MKDDITVIWRRKGETAWKSTDFFTKNEKEAQDLCQRLQIMGREAQVTRIAAVVEDARGAAS